MSNFNVELGPTKSHASPIGDNVIKMRICCRLPSRHSDHIDHYQKRFATCRKQVAHLFQCNKLRNLYNIVLHILPNRYLHYHDISL